MKYLVAHGVAPDRLTAIGYGFDRPIVDNSTELNRALNRRVQFVRTEGVKEGCPKTGPLEVDTAELLSNVPCAARRGAHKNLGPPPPFRRIPVHRLQRLLAVALMLVALPASAQYTRDNAANKKIDEAINTHYLSTDFDKAEGVLTGTVNACADKCSPQVIAKAWMYVGIVRGSGKNDQAGAKEAFQKALAADPNVKLDSAIATPETQKTFENAGGAGGVAAPPPAEEKPAPAEAPAASGGEESGEGVACSPDVRDIQTRRPIPVQCSTDEEATSSSSDTSPSGVTPGNP